MATMTAAMAASPELLVTSVTKARSIFRKSKGKRFR